MVTFLGEEITARSIRTIIVYIIVIIMMIIALFIVKPGDEKSQIKGVVIIISTTILFTLYAVSTTK